MGGTYLTGISCGVIVSPEYLKRRFALVMKYGMYSVAISSWYEAFERPIEYIINGNACGPLDCRLLLFDVKLNAQQESFYQNNEAER